MINQSSSKLKCFTVPAEGSEAALVASTLISTYPNTTVGFQHLRDQQQVRKLLFSPLLFIMLKLIIFPRQARDKHRGSSTQKGRLLLSRRCRSRCVTSCRRVCKAASQLRCWASSSPCVLYYPFEYSGNSGAF